MDEILADAETKQRMCAEKIIRYDDPIFDEKYVIGVDVSYSDTTAFGCAAVMDFQSKEIVHSESITIDCEMKYIPGFFFLREGPIIMELLKRVRYSGPILIDGNGILHPRRCGLASQVGLKMDRQAIGVTKNLLLGSVSPRIDNTAMIIDSQEIIGTALWLAEKKNPIFVSIGHRLSLETAIKIVKESSLFGYPEPLRQAHSLAKKIKELEVSCNHDRT